MKRNTSVKERVRAASTTKLTLGSVFSAAVAAAMYVLPVTPAHAVPACGTLNVNCSGPEPANHPVPTFGLPCTSCHAPAATTPPATTPPATTPPVSTAPPATTPPATTPPATTPPATTPPSTTPPATTPPVTTTPPATTPPVATPPAGMPGPMDPAKLERKVQKWNHWWADKQEDHWNHPDKLSKHYEKYRSKMEKLGQTPQPYTPGVMPSTMGRDDDDDDRRERHRGKRKN